MTGRDGGGGGSGGGGAFRGGQIFAGTRRRMSGSGVLTPHMPRLEEREGNGTGLEVIGELLRFKKTDINSQKLPLAESENTQTPPTRFD